MQNNLSPKLYDSRRNLHPRSRLGSRCASSDDIIMENESRIGMMPSLIESKSMALANHQIIKDHVSRLIRNSTRT